MADLRKVSKKELLETFDKFLLAVDFRIEHLKYATKDNSYNWDFSLQSLDSLENFILRKVSGKSNFVIMNGKYIQ